MSQPPDRIHLPAKKTKIVATIGPASHEIETLAAMIRAGMNIVRINFAHGDFDSHRRTIENARAAARRTGQRIAIFGDLPGPKIRIGRLREEPVTLRPGSRFILQTDEILGDAQRVFVSFPELPQVVKPGDEIFLDDGFIALKVIAVRDRAVETEVLIGGELRSHKGVNLPDIDLGIDVFTEADARALAFAAEMALDGVSQSFVENADDIHKVRRAARELDYDPFVIAKIERSRALAHLDSILEAADAIMVARGDLGVEVPVERVALLQKEIILKANLLAKPVITATQMLESMIHNRRPTRAEVADVTNAILDGTDAVMLSGETAIGRYPVDTVAMMTKIAVQAEAHMARVDYTQLLGLQERLAELSQDDRFSLNIKLIAETMEPSLIIAPSYSGGTARRVARFRMKPWVIAPSHLEATCQRLIFTWGVLPQLVPDAERWDDIDVRRQAARHWCEDFGVRQGRVIMIEGAGTLKARDTRRIDIVELD
jgi:pyruvate kinase